MVSPPQVLQQLAKHNLPGQAFSCLFAVLILSACQTATPNVPAQMPGPLKVKMLEVKQSKVQDSSRYLATLKSRKAVPLKPQVAGQILEIFVRSGDHVEKGEVLIKLNPEKQEATVSGITENMESIRAEKGTAEETLKSLQAAKESKMAAAEFAKQQLERYSLLFSQGAISKEQVDQKNTDLRMALADLHSTESQIKAQESTISKSQKQINQSRASISEQKAQLHYFSIEAPFAGTIGDIPVRVGEYVNTDTMLTTVNQNQPLEIYINVPTERSSLLKEGLSVRLFDAERKTLGEGKIFFISPQVNSDNQSILVKAIFDNAHNTLRSGQLVTAEIVWKNTIGLLIPTESISMLAGQAFVFVAKEDGHGHLSAQQKSVNLGEIVEGNYHVLSGLAPGDKVVSSGIQNLVDGMPIASKE